MTPLSHPLAIVLTLSLLFAVPQSLQASGTSLYHLGKLASASVSPGKENAHPQTFKNSKRPEERGDHVRYTGLLSIGSLEGVIAFDTLLFTYLVPMLGFVGLLLGLHALVRARQSGNDVQRIQAIWGTLFSGVVLGVMITAIVQQLSLF